MKKTIKRVVKKVTKEICALDNKNTTVRHLMKYEAKFKKAYGIECNVKYIDEKYKTLITRDTVNGSYTPNTNEVVVFVTTNAKKMVTTLFHELTHVYQYTYMNSSFMQSRKAMSNGSVTYKDSWHETHARHVASLLVETLDFNLDIDCAMQYAVAC